MLVFRRIHIIAQLVGSKPELGFEAYVCGRAVALLYGFRHSTSLEFSSLIAGYAETRQASRIW